MKNPIYLTIFLLLTLPLAGQQAMVDSLENALLSAKEDSFKVQLLGNLAYYTFNTDPEKSMDYARQTLDLARKIDYKGGQVNGWYKMALANLSMANMDTAAHQIDIALRLALEDGNANRILGVYNLGGVIYERKGDMDKAIDYIFESAKISERIGDTLGASGAYTNLGEIYDRKGEISLALDFYRKAYDLSKISQDTMNWVASANNLGGIEPNRQKRLAYLEEALALSNRSNFDNGKSYVYTGLAAYYWDIENNKEKALQYYQNAIYYSLRSGDNFNAVNIYTDIGGLFSVMGQKDSALYYLNKGKVLSEEYGVEEQQIESRTELANHFERYGQFQPAYNHLKELVALKDSMFNHSLAQQLAIANTKYETEKKEAQIAEQELKIAQEINTRNRIIFGSVILLLAIAAIFQWYFNRQKIKKKEAELALEKELEEAKRLRELDNLKTSFFTNISHELRTPLTLITGPLEAALEDGATSQSKEDIEMAHANSKKLLGLVNEILDLSKLEAGKLQLNNHTIQILPFLKRVFFAFESLAALKNIELKMEGDLPSDLWIKTDGDKLEKILNNLISNAIKHSPADSEVFLHHGINKGKIEFAVMDYGEGIPDNELEKVFDRFYQVESQSVKQQGGTGIGLALSKELVHLLGGNIEVKSEVGTGSTFSFHIPLVETVALNQTESSTDTEAEISDASSVYQPILINGQKPKILVVEDNLEMGQYLQKILREAYDVTLAPNGVEAIKLLQTKSFDLVTSDVMMPLMDGFELREKVNQIGKNQDLPYIFLTARALEEDKIKGLKLGVDDYITKPFNAHELLVRIQNLLQNKINRSQSDADPDANLPADTRLLKEAEAYVLENLSNPTFTVPDLAGHLGMGERQLRRVMQTLAGLSPVNFILELRLQKARQFLEEKKFFTVAEVMYEIGIESPSYFSKKFKERFGKSPGAYLS